MLRRLTLILFAAAALSVFAHSASAQLLLPAAAATVQPSTTSLVDQLANIPEFSITLASAAAGVTEEEVVDLEEGEDAESYIFISSALAHPPAPVNLGGNGSLTLTRQDTGERINAHYRNKDGTYNPEELAKINHIMRCSLTGKETEISIKLVELLDAMEDKFGKRGLTLLSGYRTPKLNGITPGAARHSMHMLGWAADIKIPGYSSTKVKNYGQRMGIGGVGYYPYKGFTHLDVGNSRYWVVRRAPRRHKPAKRSQVRKSAGVHRGPARPKTVSKPKTAKKRAV